MRAVLSLCLFVALALAQTATCPGLVMNISTIEGPVWNIYYLDSGSHQLLYILDTQDNLYRSTDEGRSFSEQFAGKRIWDAFQFAVDERIMVLEYPDVAKDSTLAHVTNNFGRTYTDITIPHLVVVIEAHPTKKDVAVALAHTQACYSAGSGGQCQSKLILTTDFGRSWSIIDYSVFVWFWAADELDVGSSGISVDTLLYLKATVSFAQSEIVRTDDLGRTKQVLASNAPGLLLYQNLTFIATVNGKTATLYTSYDAGLTLTEAVFPHAETLSENNYHILAVDDRAVMIHVDHSTSSIYDWGNIYVSNAADSTFQLSLPFNSRDANVIDAGKVNGVDGVFWANQWIVRAGQSVPAHNTPLHTVQSFDNGGRWWNLTVPAGLSCSPSSPGCALQLHGPSNTWYGAVYSRSDAPGLMTATGVVAASLPLNTAGPASYFVSRDAGATWTLAMSDYHVGELGNTGGLILAAVTSGPTDSIQYSLDQGATWSQCTFTNDPNGQFSVTNVYNEPTAHSTSFIVYGTRSVQGQGAGVVLFVNMSGLLPRVCTGDSTPGQAGSDYELFSPADPHDSVSPTCIMGGVFSVVRRLASSQCMVPQSFQFSSTTVPCACSMEDFVCDECFVPSFVDGSDDFTCVLDTVACAGFNATWLQPEPCLDSWPYYGGYAVLPGDVCDTTNPSSQPQPQIVRCGDGFPSPQPTPLPSKLPFPSNTKRPSGGGDTGGASATTTVLVVLLVLGVCCCTVSCAGVVLAYRFHPGFQAWCRSRFPGASGFLPVNADAPLTGSDSRSLLSDYDDED